MSSLVNKVKDSLSRDKGSKNYSHGRYDGEHAYDERDYGTENTGTYDRRSNEYNPAAYDPDTNPQGTGAYDGHPRTNNDSRGIHHDHQNTLSGSHPSERGEDANYGTTQHIAPGRHSDGREYVPPRGTAVSQPGHDNNQYGHDNNQYGHDNNQYGQHNQPGVSTYDRSEQAVTGRDSGGRSDIHAQREANSNIEGVLMDPADSSHGSNVMGGAGAGTEQRSRNELHHKDQQRRYESEATGRHIGGDHGQSALPTAQAGHQRDNQRAADNPYEQQRYDSEQTAHHGAGIAAAAAGAVGTGGLAYRNHQNTSGHDHDRKPVASQSQYDALPTHQGGNSSHDDQRVLRKDDSGTGIPLRSQPAAVSAASVGGIEHYGPGHPESKVLHECDHCGRDNDISHYFKKGVTYRVHR